MKVYEVGKLGGKWSYHGTRADGHAEMKSVGDDELRMTEFEVQTDKEGVLAMLNGEPIRFGKTMSWQLTPRGGLKECPL